MQAPVRPLLGVTIALNYVPGVELRVAAVYDLVDLGLHLALEPQELVGRGLAEVGVPIVGENLGSLRYTFYEFSCP